MAELRYENIPGYILSLLEISAVSKISPPPPGESVIKMFDGTERMMEESGNEIKFFNRFPENAIRIYLIF